MPEYINKQAAITEIKRIYCADCFNYNEVKCRACDFSSAIDVLEDMPKADVAPVRHGTWKYYHKQNIAVCTACSFERKLDDDFGRAVACPNCGALKEGE